MFNNNWKKKLVLTSVVLTSVLVCNVAILYEEGNIGLSCIKREILRCLIEINRAHSNKQCAGGVPVFPVAHLRSMSVKGVFL